MKRLANAFMRYIKYSLFLSFLSSAAIFIGPHHSLGIKCAMGFVVGAMILGRRLPNAVNELLDALGAFVDETFFS